MKALVTKVVMLSAKTGMIFDQVLLLWNKYTDFKKSVAPMIEQIDNELITKKPGSDSMENTEQIEVDKQASSTLEQLEYNLVE